MPFRELLVAVIKIAVFLLATWFLLWIGADAMDGEYITGILILALFIVTEALHLDPGRSVRALARRLFHAD